MGHPETFTTLHEKFGRVFKRNDTGKYEIVEGARFSNTKLRVLYGNLEDDITKGKKYSLGVLEQRFNMPISLGENVIPDLKQIDSAYDREIEIAKDLKLLTGDEASEDYQNRCKLIRNSRTSLFFAMMSPDAPILDQDFLTKMGPFLYVDDILESRGDDVNDEEECKKDTKIPYKISRQLVQILCEAISAPDGDDALEKIKANPKGILKQMLKNGKDPKTQANLMGMMMSLSGAKMAELLEFANFVLEYLCFIRKAAIETSKKNSCSSTDFLRHLAEDVDTYCLEFSKEWKGVRKHGDEKGTTMLPSMLSLRHETAGGKLFLEMILLQRGIHIPDEIRKSALFRLILDQLKVHIQKVNDIYSFEKEMTGKGDEWWNNEACVLHKRKAMSVQEAYKKLADDANQAVRQLEVLSEIFLDLWKDTKEEETVKQFDKIVRQIITGHLQWSGIVERFHENLTFDCYIE